MIIHNGIFNNKTFLFSGVRNKQLEEFIIKNGGEISNSFNSKITTLIVKDKTNITGKIKKAYEKNIPVIQIDEFIAKYN